MLLILLVFLTDIGRSTCPVQAVRMECNPLHCLQARRVKIFLKCHEALLPSVQTLNTLAGVSNKVFQGFLRYQWLSPFALHHNSKDQHTTLFLVSQSNPTPSLFLPVESWDQDDENKIYRHSRDPFASNFDRNLPPNIFLNPIHHKDPAT